VAGLLGRAPRSVENWVRRFEKNGLAGLREGEHSRRPQRLNTEQVAKISVTLRQTPRDAGLSRNLWDGTESAWACGNVNACFGPWSSDYALPHVDTA
jgi:transposase